MRAQIKISKNGNSTLEGMEQSDICDKLKELASIAGKVTSIKDKDHTPVYQDVNQNQKGS